MSAQDKGLRIIKFVKINLIITDDMIIVGKSKFIQKKKLFEKTNKTIFLFKPSSLIVCCKE